MKNLDVLGIREMDASEMRITNGGYSIPGEWIFNPPAEGEDKLYDMWINGIITL